MCVALRSWAEVRTPLCQNHKPDAFKLNINESQEHVPEVEDDSSSIARQAVEWPKVLSVLPLLTDIVLEWHLDHNNCDNKSIWTWNGEKKRG